MGNYNPDRPNILGMEWMPIAERDRPLDIFTEVGYGFTVTGAPDNTLDQVTLFAQPPSQSLSGSTIFYNVYPRGREDDTGEIKVIRLPATAVAVTGTTVIGGGTALNSLLLAGDGTAIQFDALTDQIRISVDTTSTGLPLQGKRILGVDFVYQAWGTPGFTLFPTIEAPNVVYPYDTFSGPSVAATAQTQVVSFGEVNPWWAILGGVGPNTNSSRMPFRYDELATLASGGGLSIGVKVDNLPLSGLANLGFAALDVYYCEESRVRYGGQAIGQDTTGNLSLASPTGVYIIPLRTPSFAVSGTMAAGDYSVTVTQADAGSRYNTAGLTVRELTQLYPIETHPGVEVRKFQRPVGPLPVRVPIASATDEMVAVALQQAAGNSLQFGEAPFTYCGFIGAEVYLTPAGVSVTAVQQIHNEASPGDQTYEWVRFYARRLNPVASGDLTVTVAGSTGVTITALAFAALPEITVGENGPGTGWKEVTLPISAVFTSDASFRDVTFAMTGVAVSTPLDEYQIATARTTFPPSYTNVGGYPNARYDGLQGATLTYKAPEATGIVASSTSTAVVMFSQAAPPVTGFAVTGSGCSIEVEPIGQGCAPSACIPTHILGNRLGWQFAAQDDFTRDAVASWGVASSGQSYVLVGVDTTDFFVNGSQGIQRNDTVNSLRQSFLDLGFPDFDITVQVTVPTAAVGGTMTQWVVGRATPDGSNYYAVIVSEQTSGNVEIGINKRVATVLSSISASAIVGTHTAGDSWNVRFQGAGIYLRAKAWRVGTMEPVSWLVMTTDTSLTSGTYIGLLSRLEVGNVSGTTDIAWDNLCAVPDGHADSTIEIQRMDEVDDEWQTIAELSTCVSQMCDFEARVGMTSWYRTRVVNLLDFAGPWVSGSAYLPSPAVSGVGDGNSVLIFTSNRDTSASLAYVKQFEGDPVEEFGFPEAGFQQLRTQYQRDFFTAFRPTERGGETFTADILVQAAAIPPESLADFRSLRDLAWADLPYVCVRDELGNRWFANVAVPTGRVRNNRTTYIASVVVTEVTDTPAPWEG